MSVTVSIKVRREIVEIAEQMIKLGLARSRSHAFNIMIEKGLSEVLREIEFWNQIYKKVNEFRRKNFKLKHGGLSRLLEEDRKQ